MVPAAGQLDVSGSGVGGKAGSSVDAVSAVVGTDGTGAMAAHGIATPRSSVRGSSRSSLRHTLRPRFLSMPARSSTPCSRVVCICTSPNSTRRDVI